MIFKINEFISYKILTSWPHTKIVGSSSRRRVVYCLVECVNKRWFMFSIQKQILPLDLLGGYNELIITRCGSSSIMSVSQPDPPNIFSTWVNVYAYVSPYLLLRDCLRNSNPTKHINHTILMSSNKTSHYNAHISFSREARLVLPNKQNIFSGAIISPKGTRTELPYEIHNRYILDATVV